MRVQWMRSDRARHVGLRIDPVAARVVVTLPRRTPRHEGLALLATHAEWVAARLAALPPAVPFVDGAVIGLSGHRLRILYRGGEAALTQWLGPDLLVFGPRRDIPPLVRGFLQTEARVRFAAIVRQKSLRIGVLPHRLVLKDLRSRWGSCATDRTLTFSWRLVMAPRFVQDFVIAHEVAHLRHMNHSAHFRALERELSRFAEPGRAWLRRYGVGLLRTG
jgi:predicted metal-dependent hydrolase